MALAYRSGVSRNPSLSGSSPTHSRIVLTAPASFWTRSSVCSGVESNRSLVPGPVKSKKKIEHEITAAISSNAIALHHLHGQLNPSKSIGGQRVYGLSGRLTIDGGVKGPASSLGSRGGSFKVGLTKPPLLTIVEQQLSSPKNDSNLPSIARSTHYRICPLLLIPTDVRAAGFASGLCSCVGRFKLNRVARGER